MWCLLQLATRKRNSKPNSFFLFDDAQMLVWDSYVTFIICKGSVMYSHYTFIRFWLLLIASPSPGKEAARYRLSRGSFWHKGYYCLGWWNQHGIAWDSCFHFCIISATGSSCYSQILLPHENSWLPRRWSRCSSFSLTLHIPYHILPTLMWSKERYIFWTAEDEHDVVWFWLEKGKSVECPACSQYFKAVYPSFSLNLQAN